MERLFTRINSIVTLLLLLLCAGQAQAALGKDPYAYFFNETWGNFSEEIEMARSQGKKGILLFLKWMNVHFAIV